MRWRLFVRPLLVVGLAFVPLAQQGGAAEEPAAANAERRPPAVTVARAERREIAEEVNVSGTLVAREEVLVAPEIESVAVTEILVEEGDRVEKGQVLARLSRTSLDAEAAQVAANIAQARAQIAETEAAVQETRQALERSTTLRRSGTASAQQYDQALSASQTAEARLNAARENLKVVEAQKQLLDVRLAHTEIRAPTSGIISRRTLRLGAIASMAADPSFRIIENGDIELEAEVVDATLARFEKGQPVRVTPSGVAQALPGKIRLISAEVSPTTRLGRVRVALNDSGRAIVGTFASGIVEIGRSTTITLPLSAVTVARGKSTVQALAGEKVVTKEVTTGLRSATHIEIVSGLSENEMVVARAGSFLRDGDVVTPVELQSGEDAPR
ncbi:efflux RND transporter periplasmic adaptor subunit [Terrihabitans sp. B22-R8]|uniref:efflux RND transporter periplasmic adaptor subunit n=1 Tax=Terrihabitans sp. B22-R8 TaxID=3425128 RepID=UPI00403D527B